jgi:hypothetical protein
MPITYPTLRMDGKEYVLIPKAEFKQRWEQDILDARKAARATARLKAGKSKALPLSVVKRELGL